MTRASDPSPRRPLRGGVWLKVLVVAALVAAAAIAVSRQDAPRPELVQTGSGAFTISGSVGGMKPGLATTLVITAANPQSSQMTLSSVSASVISAVYTGTTTPAPAACGGYLAPALPHTWTSWTGATVIPAASGGNPGTNTISVPLSFSDSGTNQDSCAKVTFNLSFTGSAYYTDPTTTGVIASPSPANAGAPVTLTATVSPTYSGTAPAGTVTFTGPLGQIGSPVSLSAVSGSTQATAKLTTSTLPAGSDQITAVYTPPSTGANGGPDFFGSSAATSATVNAGCVTPPTTSASTVIGPGTTYKGNYEVASGKSLWLNGGTITGNVTVDAGGQFAASGGTIGGNLSANGNSALQGTTVSGNAQSTNAAMSLGYGTTVKGNVQSQGGGPVCLNAVSVGGNVQLQTMSSTSLGSVCQTVVQGNLQVQSNKEPMQIGGSALCAGNTVAGNLQVQSNSGRVTIGAIVSGSSFGNHVAGNIQVQSNTGGGTLVGNATTGGNCQLQADSPGIAGSANTAPAGHQNTCNGTA